MSLFSSFIRNTMGSSLLFVSSLLISFESHATTVQIQTVMGNIEINLFDKTTPATVENFLFYVNSGAYTNNLIHRSDKSLSILQGGGYSYNGLSITSVKHIASVINEPVYSNVRGTISMAKISQKPNSATSEWFFNLVDNSALFDPNYANSQGYSVFGQVTEASMPVLEAIAAIDTFTIGGFSNFPVRNYTVDDYKNNAPVDDTNLVLITAVVVLNASPDTADGLTPTKNTLLKLETTEDSGGGSLGLLELCLLFILLFCSKNSFYFVKNHFAFVKNRFSKF